MSSTSETPAPPCTRCGCHSRCDEVGDRTCWCDSCWHGCTQFGEPIHIIPPPPCTRCGCSRHRDEVGDRICWCDTCRDGCCTLEEREAALEEEYAANDGGLYMCPGCDGVIECHCHEDREDRDYDGPDYEEDEDHGTVFGDCPGCYPGCYGCQADFNPADPWGDGAPEEHPGHPGYTGYDSDGGCF